MFTHNRPTQKRGELIRAKTINAPRELLARLEQMRGGGFGFTDTPFGPQFWQPGQTWRVGLTGESGIPARTTTAPITLGKSTDIIDIGLVYDPHGSGDLQLLASPLTYVGYNLSANAVAGDTYIISALVGPAWVTVWEDCPAS